MWEKIDYTMLQSYLKGYDKGAFYVLLTDIGNEKIEPYLIDINKLMKKVGYRVMSKNIDKCNDDIVYSDENQIAIIRR